MAYKIEVQVGGVLNSIKGRLRSTNSFMGLRLPSVKQEVVQRTKSGRDVDNNSFTEYSPKYAARKGVSITSVDLTDTGAMLNLSSRVERRGGQTLGIIGTNASYAPFHQDGGSVRGRPPQRKFMGLSKQQRERFIRDYTNFIIRRR